MIIMKEIFDRRGTIYSQNYYKNNNLHNNGGPMLIKYYDNDIIHEEHYYNNGRLHNINGPATVIYYSDGDIKHESYYVNGTRYTDIFQYLVACTQ